MLDLQKNMYGYFLACATSQFVWVSRKNSARAL
jgi:hypothetical protein